MRNFRGFLFLFHVLVLVGGTCYGKESFGQGGTFGRKFAVAPSRGDRFSKKIFGDKWNFFKSKNRLDSSRRDATSVIEVSPKKLKNADVSTAALLEGEKEKATITMIVFMHGTVGPRFSIKNCFVWLKNLLKGKSSGRGAYQDLIELSKKNSLHKYQPINGLGLEKIDLEKKFAKKEFGFFGQKTAEFYKKMHRLVVPGGSGLEGGTFGLRFYTFGWSGRLSQKYRFLAAEELYATLVDEQDRLRKETGKNVEINVLSHSHGCNVVLLLDRVARENRRKAVPLRELTIDRVVFFGGPVQSETERCIGCKVFKKLYHIYSKGDHMQRLDFVSTRDRFSRRAFGCCEGELRELPENLHQIEVTLGECNPFHYELWLWGRKNFPYFYYRRSVPLHPMPLSVFTPMILYLCDFADWKNAPSRICKLHFDGDESKFFLKDKSKTLSCHLDIKRFRAEACSVL